MIFLPEPGKRPPRAEPRRDERLLHVCLRVPGDPQNALADALRGLTERGGEYAEVDWIAAGASFPEKLLETAAKIQPTLVFAQIQTPGILTAGDVERLRRVSAPGVVVMQWDGDHRHDHTDVPERDWFRHLARACDINACVCTRDVEEYAEQGVPGAAYLQIGVDADIWGPSTPEPSGPEIVLLASYYSRLGYKTRLEAARMLSASFPGKFAVYGHGWNGVEGVSSRPFVPHLAEAPLYSKAVAAISVSIRNDLPRYTSDRLFRCLASGALTLVEKFPDMEGLGLLNGVNCVVWDSVEELKILVSDALTFWPVSRGSLIRTAARDLALTHTWEARMKELAYMVERVRAA